MQLLHNAYACVAVYPKGRNLARQRTQISTTANMALSTVFNRIHYLVALKKAPREDRITMLQNITSGQLACIGEIVCRIYNKSFPLLTRDLNDFDDRSLALRTLFSDRVSFRRKVTTLVHYNRMIPRLDRTYHPEATTQDQIRSQREA